MCVIEHRDIWRCVCMCVPVRASVLFECPLECYAYVRRSAMYACDRI